MNGEHSASRQGTDAAEEEKSLNPKGEENALASAPASRAWEGKSEMGLLHTARSFDEARAVLVPCVGDTIVNTDGGLIGELSKNSINKLLSGKAREKSVSIPAHLHAAANVVELFERGTHLFSEPGESGDVQASHKIFSPFVFGGETLIAKVTLNEFAREGGSRIYSVEAIEVQNPAVNSAADSESHQAHPLPDSVLETLWEMVQNVNETNTLDDIKKAEPVSPDQVPPMLIMQSQSTARVKGNMSDLYRGLIRDALDAAQREKTKTGAEREVFHERLSHRVHPF